MTVPRTEAIQTLVEDVAAVFAVAKLRGLSDATIAARAGVSVDAVRKVPTGAASLRTVEAVMWALGHELRGPFRRRG